MPNQAFAILLEGAEVTVAATNGEHVELHASRVPDVEDAGSAAPAALAERQAATISDLLRQAGCHAEPVTLGLPSDQVLAAAVTTDELPRGRRHEALCYRLEEALPVSAEQFTASFAEADSAALGVCVMTDTIKPLIAALEAAAVVVNAIAPTTLLATQHIAETDTRPAASRAQIRHPNMRWIDICGEHGHDLIGLVNARPKLWRYLHGDAASTDVMSRLIRQQHALNHTDGEAAESTTPLTAHETREHAAKMVHRSEHQGKPLWVDLRRGELAESDRLRTIRTPLRFAGTALIAALLMVSVSAWWQTAHLNGRVDDLQRQQLLVFQEALPGYRTPANPRLVLESELTKHLATRGQTGQVPPPSLALQTLHDLLGRLPDNLRFRVLEVRIDDDQVYVEGEARSHGEADLIADALRRRKGFEVEPVRTERLRDGGVGFILNAEHTAPPVALARQEDAP